MASAAVTATSDSYVNVRIQSGELRGKVDVDRKGGKYCSFYSIPYAKPPLGDLRFKAPQPAEPWKGVRDALVENPGSYAHHTIRYHDIVGQEDCLYLNVYTKTLPTKGKEKKLKPVMVYIHGGSYLTGSGRTELHSPVNLMVEDVVIVTINYRLGLLGFLSFKDPTIGIPGNAAMKDMILALKWVQTNIAYFSGDPNNVTICGESAGAGAVHILTFSPMAKGLFHRMIAMSGSALNCWAMSDCGLSAKEIGSKALNLSTLDEKEIYQKIKDLPVEEILKIQDKCATDLSPGTRWIFCPVLETGLNPEPTFLTEKPSDLLRAGKYNKVPMMMGFTDLEGLFVNFYMILLYGKILLPKDFQDNIPNTLNIPRDSDLSLSIAEKIKEFYYENQIPSLHNLKRLYVMDTDNIFAIDIMRAIRGHVQTMSEPIFFYIFSAETDLNVFKKLGKVKIKGAGHADDLGYLFRCYLSVDIVPGSVEERCVDNMITFYTNFMRNGNPNPTSSNAAIKLKWEPCTNADELVYMDLGNELSVGKNPKREAVAFWKKIYDLNPDQIRH